MTSKQPDQTEDKELLERYRRASDADASAPSDAARAAILAEGRRVADEYQNQNSHQNAQAIFDTKRPAANDSRWKIPAFGTMGAALLAALLIAPRYWETPPPSNASTAPASAPTLRQPAAAPSAGAPPTASMQEVLVAQANSRRTTAKAEVAATPTAPPKDVVAQNSATENFTSSKPAASPYERHNEAQSVAGAERAADSTSASLPSAARSGDVAQTTTLLDKGASVDARDAQGRTPLLLAISRGQLEVVRLLLRRGADPNLADSAGKTPLQQATDQNLKDIAALLRQSGAR